jgi:ubiquinone/menaquinone biosynthesis C-methylase UbiE
MTDTRDLVRRQFGAHAERYVESEWHAKGESLDRLVELAEPQSHWRVLDIATGGGHTALALAPHVGEVVATDLTRAMLDAARAFLESRGTRNVSFREADATSLPFGEGEFDLVTCRIAAHHFPDVAGFVREVLRVLRPGGRALVIDNIVPEDRAAAEFINRFEQLRDPSHNWAYNLPEWIGFFQAAGFSEIQAERFFKAREFEEWADRLSVDERTRGKLREMLAEAPPSALQALFPEDKCGKLWFHLEELLISARRP